MSSVYAYRNTNFTELKKISHVKNFAPLKLELGIKMILSASTCPKCLLMPEEKFKLIKLKKNWNQLTSRNVVVVQITLKARDEFICDYAL